MIDIDRRSGKKTAQADRGTEAAKAWSFTVARASGSCVKLSPYSMRTPRRFDTSQGDRLR